MSLRAATDGHKGGAGQARSYPAPPSCPCSEVCIEISWESRELATGGTTSIVALVTTLGVKAR